MKCSNGSEKLWAFILLSLGLEEETKLGICVFGVGVGFVRGDGRAVLPLGVHHSLASMRLIEGPSLACPSSSLRKMTVGMFLASMAFVAAAIVQVEIDVSRALLLQ